MTTLLDTVCSNLALCRIQLLIFSYDGSVLVFKDANTGNVVFLGEGRFLIQSKFTDNQWTHWVLRSLVRKRSALNLRTRKEIMVSSSRYSIHGKGNGFGRDTMRNHLGIVDSDYNFNRFTNSHDCNGYHNSLFE